MKKLLYNIAVSTRVIYIWRFFKRIREKGVKGITAQVVRTIKQTPYFKKIKKKALFKQLSEITANAPDKKVYISLSFIDWNVPLFQRPQHIARQIAKTGCLYFYHTRNHYDVVDGCQKVEDNLYLIDDFDGVVEFFSDKEKVIHVYSTNMYEDDDIRISSALKRNDTVLYEYIDEISEYIAGQKIPKFVYDRHFALLKNEAKCFVIATATILYNEVLKYRKKNLGLITNGVTLEDFQQIPTSVPPELKKLVNERKPIVGYYGALAHWFDYQLIKKTAKANPQWNFLLIGWDYDGSMKKSGIQELKNITVLGPITYDRLPQYAQIFTVCTIPFVINTITNSTSPVKIFEYMALGKPIVTTPMPECMKYDSVVISEDNSQAFQNAISRALTLVNDSAYLAKLRQNAITNTWGNKAQAILSLLDSVK